MPASEPVSRPWGPCPVTEIAGNTIRRRDISGFSLSEAVYAEGIELSKHCHTSPYLTFVLSGSYSENCARHENHWSEGALHFLPAGESHEDQFEMAVRMIRVRIDPAAILKLGEERARCLSEPREISGPLSAWLANRMIQEFRAPDDIAGLAMEGVLLEILAESVRSSDETHGSGAPGWLKRVREVLQDSYVDAPALNTLAGIAGVHPVHLSREFHKHYHMTIGEFVRKRRIEQASELLSNSDLSLAEIASACGFSDQSHFCALFKKQAGVTPAKFRNLSGNSSRINDSSRREPMLVR